MHHRMSYTCLRKEAVAFLEAKLCQMEGPLIADNVPSFSSDSTLKLRPTGRFTSTPDNGEAMSPSTAHHTHCCILQLWNHAWLVDIELVSSATDTVLIPAPCQGHTRVWKRNKIGGSMDNSRAKMLCNLRSELNSNKT